MNGQLVAYGLDFLDCTELVIIQDLVKIHDNLVQQPATTRRGCDVNSIFKFFKNIFDKDNFIILCTIFLRYSDK